MKKILLFIFISLKLFSQYSIDNGIIYIYGRPVTGADINSFEILSDSYAKDKSHVYNADRIIKDADPASFIILSDSAYTKDKTRVYRLGTAIKEADPDSFELFGNTDFSKDDILKMYEYLSKILNNLDSNHVSLTKYSNEKGKLDYVIDLETKTSNLDINFYIDDFYYNKEANNNYVSYRNNLLKLISHILKKYSLRLESINNKLKECENKDLYK